MIEAAGKRLRRAREAAGFRHATTAANHFGWHKITYTSHENGTRGFGPDEAIRYARAFGVDAAELLGMGAGAAQSTMDVRVVGEAAMGVWREVALRAEQPKKRKSLPVPSAIAKGRQAVRVADDSVNRLIQHREFAVFEAFDGKVRPGNLYVVERQRKGLAEVSIRIARQEKSGAIRLKAHSTKAAYNDDIVYTESDNSVAVLGRVVGKYVEFED